MWLFLPLVMFGACNPEHNPSDLTQLTRLQVQLEEAQRQLAEERRIKTDDREQIDFHSLRTSALYVIAGEYVNLIKPSSNGLTVCFEERSGPGWVLKPPGDERRCDRPVFFELGYDQASGHYEFVPGGD